MTQADRWLDRLDEKLRLIATQPLVGRARAEVRKDLRSFPFGRYMFFYVAIEDGIDIVRVLHSARDIDIAFQDEPRS